MNGKMLNGKLVYVSHVQNEVEPNTELQRMLERMQQNMPRQQGVNLFIKNLPKKMDEEHLRKEFSPYGTITSAKVMMEGGRCKGSGFVCFLSPEEATKAMNEMNGRVLATKPLYVAPAQRKEQRQAYLKKQWVESKRAAARPVDLNAESKGSGYVSYEHCEDAHRAVDEMNEKMLNGKLVYVSHAQNEVEPNTELQRMLERMQQNMPRQQGMNLFIKHLPKTMDEEHLRKEFSPYGTITSAKVMMVGGRCKGSGFVCFSSPEEATKAMNEMNGRVLASKPLYVAPAQRKEQRQAYLKKQWVDSKRAAASTVDPVDAEFGSRTKPLTNDSIKNVGDNLGAEKLREILGLRAVPNPVIKHHHQPSPPAQYSVATSPQAQNHAAFRQPSQQVQLHPGAHLAIQGVHPLLFQGMPGTMSPSEYHLQTPIYYVIPAGAQVPSMVASQCVISQAVDPHLASVSASVHVQGQEVLTASVLAALPLEWQKYKLGEQLYPLIENMLPKNQSIHLRLPDKVTGMLLELDNSELLQMLESAELLRSRVDEAVGVLQLHHVKQADQDCGASAPVRGA